MTSGLKLRNYVALGFQALAEVVRCREKKCAISSESQINQEIVKAFAVGRSHAFNNARMRKVRPRTTESVVADGRLHAADR